MMFYSRQALVGIFLLGLAGLAHGAAYDATHDRYNKRPELSEQSNLAVAITCNDTQTDLNPYPQAVYVGVAGDVKVLMKNADMTNDSDSSGVVFKAVPAGTILPIQIRRCIATGTTATNLTALYTK